MLHTWNAIKHLEKFDIRGLVFKAVLKRGYKYIGPDTPVGTHVPLLPQKAIK